MRKAVADLPPYKTEIFQAVLEQLRWFAGPQIRNVAVSDSGAPGAAVESCPASCFPCASHRKMFANLGKETSTQKSTPESRGSQLLSVLHWCHTSSKGNMAVVQVFHCCYHQVGETVERFD